MSPSLNTLGNDMTNPFLSWDDTEDNDTSAQAGNDFILGLNQSLVDTRSADSSLTHRASPNPLDLIDTSGLNSFEAKLLANLKERNLVSNGVINVGAERLTPEGKRIIRGSSDVNQIVPIKYEWAWQKYIDGCANHWMPTEVSMNTDIAQWKSDDILTADERWIIENALGYFSTADSIVVNNLLLSIYGRVTAAECRQYILRQAFEEAIHTHAYQYCIQSLGMGEARLFNMYRENPSMIQKDNWTFEFEKSLLDPNTSDEDFLRNLVAYYTTVEGLFFYCGFSLVFSMGRRRIMPGVCEQFQYILRDESMHLNFGVDLINQIKIENPSLWTPTMQNSCREVIGEGLVLETAYSKDLMPNGGIMNMSAASMQQYLRFTANRRCQQIGVLEVADNVANPYQWMSEMLDLRKEKNFFETRVTDYQINPLQF